MFILKVLFYDVKNTNIQTSFLHNIVLKIFFELSQKFQLLMAFVINTLLNLLIFELDYNLIV